MVTFEQRPEGGKGEQANQEDNWRKRPRDGWVAWCVLIREARRALWLGRSWEAGSK